MKEADALPAPPWELRTKKSSPDSRTTRGVKGRGRRRTETADMRDDKARDASPRRLKRPPPTRGSRRRPSVDRHRSFEANARSMCVHLEMWDAAA